MGTETNKTERNTPEYLAQLLKDKKQIQAFPNVFLHLERLLDEEINRVRTSLFHHKGANREAMLLPDGMGTVQTFSEKIYVPVKDHPDFNFVGRILGPRGMTAKELEQFTGCKIMVRGKGSMRDKKKEEMNRGKQNWEHLNEELHVLITCEDTENRSMLKLAKAVEEVKKLLVPAPEGEDDLKKMQLMELAILNGTYRDAKLPIAIASVAQQTRMLAPPMIPQALRSPAPTGAPIFLAPRMQSIPAGSPVNGAPPPPLVSPTEASGLMYNPYEYPYTLAPTAILEYPSPIEQSTAGAVPKVRRSMGGLREHPYSRVAGLANYGSMPGIATMAGMQGFTGVPGMATSLPYLKMEERN
ncbi:hypothetical protein ScPMuIL_012132 [Solemya velum]